METNIENKFIEVYLPLVKKFIDSIKDINNINIPDYLPEPFIPVFFPNYEESQYKIAFVGLESNRNSSLNEFMSEYEENPNKALFRFRDAEQLHDCEIFDSVRVGGFYWDFVYKFLAEFFDLINWKQLKDIENNTPENKKILNSIVWNNIHSIEKYEATPIKKGCNYSDYNELKMASLIFDDSQLFINLFKPQIIILLTWPLSEIWLKKLKYFSEPKIISSHFQYYQIENTHIFRTAHPRYLKMEYGYDFIITKILKIIKEKKIYKHEFPWEKNLEKDLEKKLKIIDNFKSQIESLAKDLELVIQYGPDPFAIAESSVTFNKTNWNSFRIVLGFDNSIRDFYFGINTSNRLQVLPDMIKNQCTTTFGNPKGANEDTPWCKYFDNHKNWNDETFIAIESGLLQKEINRIIGDLTNILDNNL